MQSKILNTSLAPTWIFTTSNAELNKKEELIALGVKVFESPLKNGKVDLNFVIEELNKEKIDSLLVEGGGALNFGFAEEKLVDKVYAFIAPLLIGGKKAKTGMEGSGFNKLADCITMKDLTYKKFENDILIEAYT